MEVLRDSGLTGKESEVYMFVAKSGVHKAGDISKRLKINKAQVYHALKGLEKKGLVELTLEIPTRFIAVPFEKVIDLIIESKMEEAYSYQNQKSYLLDQWNSISVSKCTVPSERFAVNEGRSTVYSNLHKMIEETQSEIAMLISRDYIQHALQEGFIESLTTLATKKNNVRLRAITYVSKENIGIMKQILRKMPTLHNNIQWKHSSAATMPYHNMMIRDNEEISFNLISNNPSATNLEVKGLWTNNKAIVFMRKALFEDMWRGGTDMFKRIHQIETMRNNRRREK